MDINSNCWSLKQFISVDLENSTLFKSLQNKDCDDTLWCNTFNDFYEQFPSYLQRSYNTIPILMSELEKNEFNIWKYQGDEILFYTEIFDYRQIAVNIMALKNAIIDYNSDLHKKNLIIRCKGTSWLAGFPISNIEISYQNEENLKLKDFIGSSIDTGFRLAKYSSTRKLVMSVDTVFLFAHGVLDLYLSKESLPLPDDFILRFDGKHELKGVIGNGLYPVFWLDVQAGMDNFEDIWLGLGASCTLYDVIKYTEEFLTNKNNSLTVPFIENDKGGKFGDVPLDFTKRKDMAIKTRMTDDKNWEDAAAVSASDLVEFSDPEIV